MGEQSWWVTVARAVVTVLLVTAVVAGAVGVATYLASRILVGMMS